jgi:hypothetical protein
VPVGIVFVAVGAGDLGRVVAALAAAPVADVVAGGSSAAVTTPPIGAALSAASVVGAAPASPPAVAAAGGGTWVKVTWRGLAGPAPGRAAMTPNPAPRTTVVATSALARRRFRYAVTSSTSSLPQ